MVSFLFMFHYTHTHTHAHTHTHTHTYAGTAVSHILMALLWPEHAWSGLGRGRDPGLTEAHQSYRGVREPERLTHIVQKKREKKWTHTHGRNSWGGWLLGHRCGDQGRKWELFPRFLPPPSPLKRNSSLTLGLPPPRAFENIPFPSTFPSPNLKPTLHSPPQRHHPSPPPSPSLN